MCPPPSRVYTHKHTHTHTYIDMLRSMLSRFGKVADSIVVRDRYTGISRGFGFVHTHTDTCVYTHSLTYLLTHPLTRVSLTHSLTLESMEMM